VEGAETLGHVLLAHVEGEAPSFALLRPRATSSLASELAAGEA
jgi:hypothetical protein